MNLRTGILLTIIAAAFAWYVSSKPMDFRVYHYGARGVFDGTRPVYGASSGLGWPMHYRYPPLFLLLFTPFAMLPLGLSAGLWVVAKFSVLILLVRDLVRRRAPPSWWIPVLLAAPFVVQDFRYGNAQFFVFALAACGLLLARERPVLAGAALGLGIATKIWPAFFLPYLVVRRDWKAAGWTVIITLVLTLLPSAYFGIGGNNNLLDQWVHQESATQTGQEEIWFPSQSLRGVMMRYLTVIDYSQVPDSNYRLVHVAALSPATIRTVWLTAAALAYAAFLGFVARRRESSGWEEAALGFCLIGLLQPFTQKYALVILLWPALAASHFLANRTARILIYVSVGLVWIQPLIPGSAAQRLLQVLGFDFFATLALAAAVAIGATTYPRSV